jgi:hypothetical protein
MSEVHENLTLSCMKETPMKIQDMILGTFLKLETRCFLAAERTKGSFITLNWQIANLFLFFYRIFKLIKHIIDNHIISFLCKLTEIPPFNYCTPSDSIFVIISLNI